MPLSSYLDTQPVLGDRVYLHSSCQVIGDVVMGDDCSIWCNTVLRGDVNRIVIGRGSNVQDHR
jgi:carbonic anhydrase/acetyltransferase-like protein (isoleucine patch superfamily)